MSESWWLSELRAGLSQGDILDRVLFPSLPGAPVPIKKETIASRQAWVEVQEPHIGGDGYSQWITRARVLPGVVLSHSCDLDKGDLRRQRVWIAPVSSLNGISEQDRDRILAQRVRRNMPLPEIPDLGDCYADLRSATVADRHLLDKSRRVVSMTDAATKRLMLQLIEFFAHVKFKPEDMTVPDE